MNKLAELRADAKKSQAQIAIDFSKFADVEISQQLWHSWESGRTLPKAIIMTKLKEFFKMDKVESIFFGAFNNKT
ncbi:MAG: helix-turn-helix transcriptional regulator [Bacillota bacterium]